jgi:enamine deaminase RidA (YjgF/YER057c/UK114 family)
VNLIARLKGYLGDLDRVTQIVKLLSMVNATPDFIEPPAVSNGCSDLLVEVFGDRGRHARSAIGVATLPGGIPIEIELIAEISD